MAKKKKNSPVELELNDIRPLTDNQKIVFDSKRNMVLCGFAGTGKSFLSCYLGFNSVAENKHDSVIIIRSAVPTRSIGFLPGNDKEKVQVYEEPYAAICSEIFQRGDAYEILKAKNILEFRSTSHIRGLTLDNAFLIVDEIQNMSFHELDSLITRVGEGCRIIFCGDFKQADLKENGMKSFLRILNKMESSFDIVDFKLEDIVRSKFVKDYLVTKESLGL